MAKFSNHVIQHTGNQCIRYLLTLGANPEDAKDIVQESLYKALLYMEVIEEDKFSAWVHKVSVNRFYDLVRSTQTLHRALQDIYMAQNATSTEDLILSRDRLQTLHKALAKLSAIQQDLIRLRYEHELSYNEIAQRLNITEHKVKTYLFRAKQRLKKLLEGTL